MILHDLLDHSPRQLGDLFRACFAGYLVEVRFDDATFAERLRMDGVDLAASRWVELDGDPVGVLLLSRRGPAVRLAAMGLTEATRGRGIGRASLAAVLEECRARGDREMWLEVIEPNTAGVALYRGAGFTVQRRFTGHRAPVDQARPEELQPADLRDFHVVLAREGGDALPWQASPASLAWLGAPYRAFRRGPAWAMVTDPDRDPVVLKALVVEEASRRQGHGVALLRALAASTKGGLRVPAIVPEELAPLFDAAGWDRDPLTQFEMRLSLGSA